MKMFMPVPHVKLAKAKIIPAFGFLLLYLKNRAVIGIKIIKLISPIILANIVIKERVNVTVNLLAFWVNSVKNDCKNPLLSMIPIPINVIRSILSGANDAKLATVVLNISFKPDRLKRDITETAVESTLPLIVLTEL